MKVSKNNYTFNVHGKFSENWFSKALNNWEEETFHILEHYKNNNKSLYIDIGTWIGPTVLYSANIYNKVIGIEPDPIALERLYDNLRVNDYDNIHIINKALSDHDGKTLFGGNGDLGNSESTLLINDDKFLTYPGRHTTYHHQNAIIEVDTITIDTLIKDTKINPKDISLIKIDIEGGEKIVIPHLQNFLKIYKMPLYISLHYCFLQVVDVLNIINILFDIYNSCYYFTKKGDKIKVTKKDCIDNKYEGLVFE